MTKSLNGAAEQTVHVLAPAKLNLTLDVVGRRADGYHLLESVMQSIDIADVVRVSPVPDAPNSLEKAAPGVSGAIVTGRGADGPNGMLVPDGESNLAVRALTALRGVLAASEAGPAETAARSTTTARPKLHIDIDKRIPVAAGLGGGSADAAAALVAANDLWELGWTRARLAAVGLHVGADVPFCVHGGTAIARGVGERLTPIRDIDTTRWAGVVLNPGFAVSTVDVYSRYRETAAEGTAPEDARSRTEAMVEALQRGDAEGVGRLLFNALEPISTELHPEIGALRRRAMQAGALGAVMCGSGPSVFALARDEEGARKLAARLANTAPYVACCGFLHRGSRLVAAEAAV